GTAVYTLSGITKKLAQQTVRVGRNTATDELANGLISDFVLVPYAAEADEIRAWYESQVALFHPTQIHLAL
ncbi:MAG TPA: hypothetical protein VFK03_04130, partial [Candidatus Saccharimonadales bacterium]|nr:hypothetical protein [Candidatus Saccharimonadales bacterium]